MKTKLRFLLAATTLAFLATGCQRENNGNNTPEEGEKSTVSMTITANQSAITRGTSETHEPDDAENVILVEKQVNVYVFKADGTLDYNQKLDLNMVEEGVYKVDPFEITAGDRYFYVFVNDGRQIATPLSMESFMKTAIPTAYVDNVPAAIVKTNELLMGTLWAEKKTVAAGGTTNDPIKVELNIGRLASKVNLKDIQYDKGNDALLGKFQDGKYRLGALPLNINNVGVSENFDNPTTNGVLVESYVHNKISSDTDYLLTMSDGAWKEAGLSFYATENTTAPDEQNKWQYYGNTSFIQIETRYVPDMHEVYNISTGEVLRPQVGDPFGEGTFWTGEINNVRHLFNGDPRTSDIEAFKKAMNVKEYEGGLNYHKFAIFDKNETTDICKFRVLRNHYYEFTVTKFNDLGSPGKNVDPGEPLPTKTTVEVKVTVLPWSKVEGSVEL